MLGRIFNRFRRVSLSQKIHFCRNLQVMIRAGLSLSVGLETLIKQTDNKKFKSILIDLRETVEKGQPLGEGLARHPDTFSEFFINMVKAGERSGKLEDVLVQLAIQMKKTRELVGKVKGALMYPIFIVITTIAIGIFIFIFVVPKLTTVFTELEATLPWTTRALIAVSNFVIHYGWLILIGLAILIVLFLKFATSRRGKEFLHKIQLKLPILAPIVKKVNLAKFSRTFSALLMTDIPIMETLQLTASVLGNVFYRKAVLEAAEGVEKGIPVSAILQKNPELFPPIFTQMVAVGEQTGTLDSILADITQFYEEDVERTMASLSSIIEPILIVLLGIVVGVIAMAVIMPMYSLTQQIQ